MMRKYKFSLIFGSIVTLLPMVIGLILWDRLPELIPVHWGKTGQVDGYSGPWCIVFLLPLFLLALQWLCVWITFRDPKAKNQNTKAMHLAFWVVPIISIFSSGIIYAAGFHSSINLFRIVPLFLGALLVVIGNYMPKITQNSFLGIKTRWTLYSTENWHSTHRFCGKVWVTCGFTALVGAFLPEILLIVACVLSFLGLILSSTFYSYFYYRKQLREGMAPIPKKPLTKKKLLTIFAISCAAMVFVGALVYIMFTGDIHVSYHQESFTIEADFISDLTVDYDAITSLELVESANYGMRVSGFNSARLLMGKFRNQDYGNYTLYAYTGNHTAVLLRNQDHILLIAGKTPEESRAIYETLKERIP